MQHFTSPNTVSSVRYSGLKHATTGPWSSGNLLFGLMNHTSPFGSLMGEPGFGMPEE